jgi:hypothetical protein
VKAKFTELLGRLRFDGEVLEWVRDALHASHADVRREREEAIRRHQVECKRLQDRISAMYLDKLDGVVDTTFFETMSNQWREEQNRCLREIDRHQIADQSYFLVDDPRYVTGQFNAHMASCLLLQADEAVWAGDKAAEGRLKGLITSPIQQIEAKGVDPIRLKNYVRLVMTSNESWVAPAGRDERRFAVLDVDPRCVGNHAYFAEMAAELRDGGYEALLADLLAFDLERVSLRTISKTAALLYQKERSLDPVSAWWLDRLDSGHTTRGAQMWETLGTSQGLFDDYIASADRVGVKRKADETIFGQDLRRLVPRLQRVRRTVGGVRAWCYEIPPLIECREAWNEAMSQPRDWSTDPDDGEPFGAGEREGSADFWRSETFGPTCPTSVLRWDSRRGVENKDVSHLSRLFPSRAARRRCHR